MKKFIIGTGALLIPGLAFAQNFSDVYLTTGFGSILKILNTYVIPGLIVLATIYFLWTVIQYIRAKDAKGQEEHRGRMIQGIIGLVVIVAVWGIVKVVTNVFDIGGPNTANPACPPGYTWQAASHKCN